MLIPETINGFYQFSVAIPLYNFSLPYASRSLAEKNKKKSTKKYIRATISKLHCKSRNFPWFGLWCHASLGNATLTRLSEGSSDIRKNC
jgi:hypothetical protein